MNGHGDYKIAAFKQWLLEHGGYIHPDVYFKPGTCSQHLTVIQGGAVTLMADS